MKNRHLQMGSKVKRLRHQRGLSQTQLADALAISASYLNLIEHNRRTLTVPLLFKLSSYFGIDPVELAENDDKQLVGDLMELFGDDLFADSDLTNHDIRDLVQNHPSISRAVLKLFDRVRALEQVESSTLQASSGYNVMTEAVSDYLQENGNYFATLEQIAEQTRQKIDEMGEHFEQALKDYLCRHYGITTVFTTLPDHLIRHYDEDDKKLLISNSLAVESAQFIIAQHLALMVARDEINAMIEASTLPQPGSNGLITSVLSSYVAAAIIMPYEPFYRACRETRYDVDRIARLFRTTFEQVCHRMTTLQRPGMSGIPLHLVRTDIAGNISKRFSLSGIHVPRHTGCCPRWNIYAAFLNPDQINIQVSEMPDGKRYFCIARTLIKSGTSYRAPQRFLSIGLGCAVHHASEMIYSDGFDVHGAQASVKIGVGCRICPRNDCVQRAHPPADHRFSQPVQDRKQNLYME